MIKSRVVQSLLVATMMIVASSSSQAAKSFKIPPGKLVIYGEPKAERKDGQVHIWWNYSWYYRVGGEKVAEGKGKVFDVTVSGDGGSFDQEYEHNGLLLKVEGEVEGNEVHIDGTGSFKYKSTTKEIGSFEFTAKIGE